MSVTLRRGYWTGKIAPPLVGFICDRDLPYPSGPRRDYVLLRVACSIFKECFSAQRTSSDGLSHYTSGLVVKSLRKRDLAPTARCDILRMIMPTARISSSVGRTPYGMIRGAACKTWPSCRRS